MEENRLAETMNTSEGTEFDEETEDVALQHALLRKYSEKQRIWNEFNRRHQQAMKTMLIKLEEAPKGALKPDFTTELHEVRDWIGEVGTDLGNLREIAVVAVQKNAEKRAVLGCVAPVLEDRLTDASKKLAEILGDQ